MLSLLLKPFLLILGIILSILLICSIPPILILLIPFHIFRFLVVTAAKCFRSDLDKVLSMRSNLIAMGDIDNPLYNNQIITTVFEGSLDIRHIRKVWDEKIMNAKMDNGKLRYPELKQYAHKWLGYLFWKPDKTFSLENHIQRYDWSRFSSTIHSSDKMKTDSYSKTEDPDCGIVDFEKLVKIRSELCTTSFNNFQSPWEMIIIDKYFPKHPEEGKTYSSLVFRWHHTLADAYSIMKIFIIYLRETPPSDSMEAKPKYEKQSFCTMVFKTLVFLAAQPVKGLMIKNLMNDINPWHPPMSKVSHKFYLTVVDPIPLSTLREISKANEATVSGVVHAVVFGAIRRMMTKKFIDVPVFMQLSLPLPLPGHPDKLRNHATAATVVNPIGIKDPIERLKEINKNYLDIKSSALPFMNTIGGVLLGAFPYCVARLFDLTYATVFVSNFPGPKDFDTVFSHKIVSIDGIVSLPRGNFGVVVIAFSCNGKIHMNVGIERNLVTGIEEAGEFSNCLFEEIKALQGSAV